MDGSKRLIETNISDVIINFGSREVTIMFGKDENYEMSGKLIGLAAGFHDFLHLAYDHEGTVSNIVTTDFKSWYYLEK